VGLCQEAQAYVALSWSRWKVATGVFSQARVNGWHHPLDAHLLLCLLVSLLLYPHYTLQVTARLPVYHLKVPHWSFLRKLGVLMWRSLLDVAPPRRSMYLLTLFQHIALPGTDRGLQPMVSEVLLVVLKCRRGCTPTCRTTLTTAPWLVKVRLPSAQRCLSTSARGTQCLGTLQRSPTVDLKLVTDCCTCKQYAEPGPWQPPCPEYPSSPESGFPNSHARVQSICVVSKTGLQWSCLCCPSLRLVQLPKQRPCLGGLAFLL
jgi:hypothetical protein